MSEKENSIIPSYATAIFNPDLAVITEDWIEFELDELIESSELVDVAEKIPLVKTVVSVYKTGKNILDVFKTKKILCFLQSLANENIDEKELEKRKLAFKNNEKWVFKEIETIAIYIEKSSSSKKSVIQAKLYAALLRSEIEYKEFVEFMCLADMLIVDDLDMLVHMHIHQDCKNISRVKCNRLQALGLMDKCSLVTFDSLNTDKFIVSDLGHQLCNILNWI